MLVRDHVPARVRPTLGRARARHRAFAQPAGRQPGAMMVEQVAGGKTLPAEVLERILARTDGVPLFLEELTKAILEFGPAPGRGRPLRDGGPATVVGDPGDPAGFARWPGSTGWPTAKEVAQVGAVIGREFSHKLLATVTSLNDGELQDALGQLVGAGLIFRRGELPEASYNFKHALVRDAAHESLLKSRRQELHGRIAHALEVRPPELTETAPELIAHHLAEAGEAERAVGYWLKAGRRSAERSAEREAVRQLRRGLGALATLPPSVERDRSELDLQLALGPRLASSFSYTSPEVAAAYERARTLCERFEDVNRLLPALYGLFAHYVVRGECRTALDFAERLRASAGRGGDPVDRLVGHRAVGTALMQLGSLQEAQSELDAALALHDPRRDRSLVARYVIDPHASGLAYKALLLWILGHPNQARLTAREAIRDAPDSGTLARSATFGFTRAPSLPCCSATAARPRPTPMR